MAVNPHTPVLLLEDIVADLDMVLIMSVNPGFGAQKFIEHTYTKISEVKELSALKNPNMLIEVDGGVDSSNALKLIKAGANVLVAGNSVFSAANQLTAISQLKHSPHYNFKLWLCSLQ